MGEVKTKSELLERISAERQLLEEVLDAISQEDMLIQELPGGWSIKDILAHIVTWEENMVSWLEVALKGNEPQMLPPGFNSWEDIDAINEGYYQLNKDKTLTQVTEDFIHSYKRAIDVLLDAEEPDLMIADRFPWRKGEPLWQMVASNTFWHYEEHSQDIRAWLAKKSTFPILILIGRPASGKSEIIDFLMNCDPDQRRNRFYINELNVFDDFPMLWVWFEEDHILSKKFGAPRLYTDEEGYFIKNYFWHLLIERLNLEYTKCLRGHPSYHQTHTAIIEFSRGKEHGGYEEALEHLSTDVLSRAGIVYVNVSFEESLHKNRRRFNPERPDSILEHSLPDEKIKRLYRDDDWADFCERDEEFITVGDVRVPYVVFENQDDVTTGNPEVLAVRLEKVLDRLWKLRSKQ